MVVGAVGEGFSGVLGGARTIVQTVHETALDNQFMAWNTMLALVPLALALALFRDHVRTGVAWWAGAVAWLLFLPNAPYVLTDVVHLLDDIRESSDSTFYTGLLPVYGAFFAVGFGAYVANLHLLRRFVFARGLAPRWLVIEMGVHALCAVGIYLGRFVRLNSWDVVTAPHTVTGTLDELARRFPIGIMLITFVVLAAGTFVANAVLAASADAAQRVVQRLRTTFR
jgi:uncharacterized membrane protein